MPRDYKDNTYKTKKIHKEFGLDGWDRLLIVVFITILALVIKHFILLEREKHSSSEQTVTTAPADTTKTDAKVATATSTAQQAVNDLAIATGLPGLTDDEIKAEPPKAENPQAAKKPKPVETPIPPRQDLIPVEPHFDFYTILPKVEVVIPDHEIKTRIREEKLGEGDKTAKYIMQAGSYRDVPEAEKLKAKLTAMGIESRIEKAQIGEALWYRVKVGPYSGMTTVMTIKNQLRDAGIDAIVFAFN